jgi:hypothetical protein
MAGSHTMLMTLDSSIAEGVIQLGIALVPVVLTVVLTG